MTSETEHETDVPPNDSQPNRMASPLGMRRRDHRGGEIIDAMAGRASVLGFGCDTIGDAIEATARQYLGDASAFDSHATFDDHGEDNVVPLRDELLAYLGKSPPVSSDCIWLCPSPDVAVDAAIGLARTYGHDNAFRTVALVGADHGRTGVCRTASGRPVLQEGYGPMMAGFTHVPPGDLDAIAAAVDQQTACVLLSPVDWVAAARARDPSYLTGIREICDQHEALLVIDETQIPIGSSGHRFAFSAISGIRADLVILAAGLFAGLPGGLILAPRRVTGHSGCNASQYPLQAAVASATLSAMTRQGLPASARDRIRELAVALAEKLSGFQFIRDVNVLGMTIGIETDIESREIVRVARSKGLRVEAAGEIGICIQPPLVLSPDDQQMLVTRISETMEAIERETAELSI